MSRSSLLICIFIFIVILGTSGIVQGALPAAYTLPPLPYDYNALEPYIDEATMRVHHTGHHAAYTNNLNAALASIRSDPELLAKCNIDGGEEMDTVAELLQLCVAKPDVLPPALATTIRNNGGGFLNHAIFWSLMHPTNKPGMEPRTAETSFGAYGSLLRAIISTFNSMENFRKEFDSKATALFGSGWVWLVYSPSESKLKIVSLPNQDSPALNGDLPVLGIDVWEHAYYLKHQNKRADYIKAWWNVINWDTAEFLYNDALNTVAKNQQHDEL